MIFVYDCEGVPDPDPYLDVETAYILAVDGGENWDNSDFAIVYFAIQRKGTVTRYIPSLR